MAIVIKMRKVSVVAFFVVYLQMAAPVLGPGKVRRRAILTENHLFPIPAPCQGLGIHKTI